MAMSLQDYLFYAVAESIVEPSDTRLRQWAEEAAQDRLFLIPESCVWKDEIARARHAARVWVENGTPPIG